MIKMDSKDYAIIVLGLAFVTLVLCQIFIPLTMADVWQRARNAINWPWW